MLSEILRFWAKNPNYDSYGNILDDSNPSFAVPLGFASGLHDRDTGLVRFGYRDFDPDTGRWTAKDPIGFAGGDTDLYGYVFNNPVNYVDPEGLLFFNLGTAAAGAAIGALSNGISAAINGGPIGKAMITGAVGGAIAGFTLNPFIAGAAIGATTTYLNNEFDVTPCKNSVIVGGLLGLVGGGLGGHVGKTLAHETPQLGAAVGEVAGTHAANAVHSFVNFWKGF